MMKTFIFVVLCYYVAAVLGDELSEEEGFRRLLRRASAEADRPLVREQRRNSDDDEDSFEFSHEEVVRKRREEEDHFYHTLLKRAESKRHEKRSFDTDDVENNDVVSPREDWTGDSKISDADKSELANLFAKLKSDESEVKADVTRSTTDDDVTVDNAASDYTAWLMEQPKNKISQALTHKAEVDHSLTKMLYQEKRDTKAVEHLEGHEKQKNVYPEPKIWHVANIKKSETERIASSNDTNATLVDVTNQTDTASFSNGTKNETSSCVTPECTCKTFCEPKQIVTITPCACQEAPTNATTSDVNKKSNSLVAKLCSDDTPQCLCTRACYPKSTASVSPCACEGDATSVKSGDTLNAVKSPQITEKNKTSVLNTSVDPQICSDTSSECVCKKACYPNPIARITPCACNMITKSSQQKQQQQTGIGGESGGAKPVTQSAVQQSISSNVTQSHPAVTSVASTGLNQPAVTSVASTGLNQPATAANVTTVNDPIAHGWCERACQPYGVAEGNPCKCTRQMTASAEAKSFPPRAPGVAPDPVNSNIQGTSVTGYNYQAQNSYYYGYANSPQVAPQLQPQAALAKSSQVQQPLTTNPDTRALQEAHGICGRSCYPHRVLSQQPCTCEKPTTKKVVAGAKKPGSSRLYLKSANYQGCFSDLKAPTRDLPKRFTRYDTTPENCVQECKYQNYKFAGVQYGYLCFCGNAFGRYTRLPDNDCNSKCKGDAFRNCGGYYHNSVYSVDGKEYDPTDFDFGRIDEEERRRDYMASGPTYPTYPAQAYAQQQNTQGANAATHLMKAAEAALFAAQKLLPSASKKHKVNRHGRKVKREDDEEDAQIMQEKMAGMASLGAVNEILRKSSFSREKREADREKRSVDEDSDPYDPEDGKELLTAYLSNVDLYKRQTRSVDDDEEDDDVSDKTKFEYKRMTLGETDEGEFVEKYFDAEKEKEKDHDDLILKKRSLPEGNGQMLQKRSSRSTSEGSGQMLQKRSNRSTSEGSGQMLQKRSRRSTSEGSGQMLQKRSRRSTSEGSGQMVQKRSSRSTSEGSGQMLQKQSSRSTSEGSGQVLQKRSSRSTSEGSGQMLQKRSSRSTSEGSGQMLQKQSSRSTSEGSGQVLQKRSSRSTSEGSGQMLQKRSSRSTSEGSGQMLQKQSSRSTSEGSGQMLQKRSRRSTSEGSGQMLQKRSSRSTSEGSGQMLQKRSSRSTSEGSGQVLQKRSSSSTSEGSGQMLQKRSSRSTSEGSGQMLQKRSRRSTSEGSGQVLQKRSSRSTSEGSGQVLQKRTSRSTSEGSGQMLQKRSSRSTSEGSGQMLQKQSSRSTSEGSGQVLQKRSSRSTSEGSGQMLQKRSRRSTSEGSGQMLQKRSSRSTSEGSGQMLQKRSRRSTSEGSGQVLQKRSSRSTSEGSGQVLQKRTSRSTSEGSGQMLQKRSSRSTSEGSGQVLQIRSSRSTSEGSGQMLQKRSSRSTSEGSGQMLQKQSSRSTSEGSSQVLQKRSSRSTSEGSGQMLQKRSSRSTSEGSGQMLQKRSRRSTSEGSGQMLQKRSSRSTSEGSGQMLQKRSRRSTSEGSGQVLQKRSSRSTSEGSGQVLQKRTSRSTSEGSGQMLQKRSSRSTSEGSGQILDTRSRRNTLEGNGKLFTLHSKRSLPEGSGLALKKRAVVHEGSGENSKRKRSTTTRNVGRFARDGSGLEESTKNKRELVMKNLPEGAVKMAARSKDVKDVEASLRALEYIAKRDETPGEVAVKSESGADEQTSDDSEDIVGENESGADEEEETDQDSGDGSSGGEDEAATLREDNSDIDKLFEKRSLDETGDDTNGENAKLRGDVDKGVDSLLNLVVELYKQQKTIKTFESSVRSLRNDIIKELSVPNQKRPYASKKVREEIEKRAKDRLHVLTSSIENKIRSFAQAHPQASKQANLARSLLPSIPLPDDKFSEAKREISRRSAEFDSIEDSFSEPQTNNIPDILKEHFRRNVEEDEDSVADYETNDVRKPTLNGEQHLSRMHRDVQEVEIENRKDEYESLFQK